MAREPTNWRKHFESLSTEKLVLLLAVGSFTHKEIVAQIVKERGVSDSELSEQISLINESRGQEELQYMQEEQTYEATRLKRIVWITGIIFVATVVLLIVFYTRITSDLFNYDLRLIEYACLSVIVASVVIPWYLFNYFLIGGELVIYTTTDYGSKLDGYMKHSQEVAMLFFVISLFNLDPITTIFVYSASTCVYIFIFAVLTYITNAGVAQFIRDRILHVFRIGNMAAIIYTYVFIISFMN
jgi:hypothetical protein